MDKILSEHRKDLGGFEVVDVVEETDMAHLRGRLDYDTPVTVNWTWEYGSEVAELRRLYEKGKKGQWNAETDVDWSIPLTNDEWVLNPEASMLAQTCKLMGKDEATQKAAAYDELAYIFSQLLHGEQAALQICGQLTNVCKEMDQKFYAASQTIDEARHIEVMSKLLMEKFGTIYPSSPTIKVLLDILLEAEGMQKKVLGMQTLFEGIAVGIMDITRQESRNPLVSDILHRVEGDESRHAAFGVLNMRRIVRDAEPEQMAEMEDWAFGVLETLNAGQQLNMLRLFGEKYGLDPELTTQGMTQLPEFAELNSPIFMHTVAPNLDRLGLITERTRDRWFELGMMVESRYDPETRLPLAG